MEIFHTRLLFSPLLFYCTVAAPQQPEINDQFQNPKLDLPTQSENAEAHSTTTTAKSVGDNDIIIMAENPRNVSTRRNENETKSSFTMKIYYTLSAPIVKFVSTPKVSSVLRNIGTCVVNGAMEIVTHYFPAPLIPLIASAAGMVIPFEPVVLLKEKMPVTSYRRAFQTAMNTFLRTFDKYKIEDDIDPYMTRRFNRRLNVDKNEDNVVHQ